MRYDYSLIEDKESYASVPSGTYMCKVSEVRPGQARDGSARWSLRLEVVEGEYAGRLAAWDSITWSERGVVRVKRVLAALGFDVRGELEVEPSDLEDLQARVQVVLEEWEDPISGRRQERMAVPYLGWAPAEAPGGNSAVDDPEVRGEALAHDTVAPGDSPF